MAMKTTLQVMRGRNSWKESLKVGKTSTGAVVEIVAW